MADLLAPVAEGHRRGRRVGHSVAQAGKRRIEPAQQGRGDVGGNAEDDRGRLQARCLRHEYVLPCAAQFPHARGHPDRVAPQRRAKRIDKLADAARQRDERTLRRRSDPQRAERSQHASCLALGLPQPGEQCAHRQSFGVARVDARQERLADVLGRLCAEAPSHERSDRFIIGRGGARDEGFARDPHPAASGEQRRSGERAEPDRKAEEGPFDDGVQLAVSHHIRGPGLKRRHQAVGEAQFAAERHGGGFLHEQRVGTGVHDPPVEALRDDDTAHARRRFEDPDLEAAPLQLVCGRESSDAAADDRHIDGVAGHRIWREALWTYCASI